MDLERYYFSIYINSLYIYSLYKTVLPKTDKKLYNVVLNKLKAQKNRTYNQHFSSEITLKSVSEREVARIFEEELNFYRSLEVAKKDFQKTYNITLKEIFKLIDFKSKGYLDYESLYNFMGRLKVLFNKDEYWALLRRIAVNLDNKIEYEELVYAISPNEPYEYPAFREKFQWTDPLDKALEFGFIESHTEFKDFDKRRRPLSYLGSSLRQKGRIFIDKDPFGKEKKNFIYDQSYHKEYHNYKAKYIEPSKDLSYLYKKSNVGVKGVDDFFEDYYMYLNDREKSEEFFNKYGKRYTYQNGLDSFRKKNLEYQEQMLVDTYRYNLSKFKH